MVHALVPITINTPHFLWGCTRRRVNNNVKRSSGTWRRRRKGPELNLCNWKVRPGRVAVSIRMPRFWRPQRGHTFRAALIKSRWNATRPAGAPNRKPANWHLIQRVSHAAASAHLILLFKAAAARIAIITLHLISPNKWRINRAAKWCIVYASRARRVIDIKK